MHNIGGPDQIISIDFLSIDGNIFQIEGTITEVFQCELFLEKFVECFVQSILYEVLYWVKIRNLSYNCVKDVLEHRDILFIILLHQSKNLSKSYSLS